MDNAVLILEKTSFDNSDLDTVLGDATTFRLQLKNDIYHSYLTRPPPDVNEVKATLVCPATAKHLEKYTQQEMFLVTETEQDYRDITLPFLLESQFSLQWVYNILEGRAEQNHVVFDDPDPENGFVLLPDLKWDQKEATQLYLVAICRRRNIKSLRDLTGNHLPLLENVFFQTQAEVLSHFGVPASQLRCYLHYQPSYYHLHVHITHLAADVPGSGVERAHLLTDVIHDLRRDGDVCRTRPLSFPLRSNDELLARFRDAGRL
uniref:m7GpppX diphosphatase n=1 Tax=Eptatretus burgeri TaxID=7764 RepID=A0A8C4PXY7_EPTBU